MCSFKSRFLGVLKYLSNHIIMIYTPVNKLLNYTLNQNRVQNLHITRSSELCVCNYLHTTRSSELCACNCIPITRSSELCACKIFIACITSKCKFQNNFPHYQRFLSAFGMTVSKKPIKEEKRAASPPFFLLY